MSAASATEHRGRSALIPRADEPCALKCRTVKGILEEKGLEVDYIHYLEQVPNREELERVLALLGTDDPRKIVRTGEPVYRELHLDAVDRDTLLDAMVENPILIERPIVIKGDKAVIGRPTEGVLDLFDADRLPGAPSQQPT